MKIEKIAHGSKEIIARIEGFIKRPKLNYRVAITRAAASSFLLGLTAQYNSIYTVALGASKIQLGSISSIGNGVSALISAPLGWLVDRYGLKRFYLMGIGLTAAAMLVYATAPDWKAIIVAMIILSLSMRLIGTGCSVICADSLEKKDRATGQNLCGTLQRLSALLAPMIAAFLVTAFGGMNAKGIRPLYYIRFVGYIFILLFVAAKLQEPQRMKMSEEEGEKSFIHDFRRIFEHSPVLRRWIVIASLTPLPLALTAPFLPLFAEEVKGADQFILGGMATAATAVYLIFGIPMGRLADKIGRKRVIYLATPLWYISNLLLVFSTSSTTLVMAGALQSFYFISSIVTSSMTLELVPVAQMGRWSGLIGFSRGLVAVPAPLIGGLVWRNVGPAYVFLIPILVDLFLRIPLLTTIPETLDGE